MQGIRLSKPKENVVFKVEEIINKLIAEIPAWLKVV
jgi:uncharacterized protein YfkK (UPF0435 family)